MADRRRARTRRLRQETEDVARAVPVSREDESERQLARTFSYVVPPLGLGSALIVGWTSGLAPAILVLAGTALVATIAFFWASLRTLSGEAPLAEGVQPHGFWARAPAPERKREALRALKDLELEHSIGKIDDADYKELETRYRDVAKALMREQDAGLSPRREQAEALVKAYLEKRLLLSAETTTSSERTSAPPVAPSSRDELPSRRACEKCSVANDPDASFCKKCGSSLVAPATATEKADASL